MNNFMNRIPFYRTLNLQLFAADTGDGGNGGDGGGQGDGDESGAGGGNQDDEPPELDPKVKAYLDKIRQSDADKIRTKYAKEKSDLERELNQLKKKNMTESERIELERSELAKAKREVEQEKLGVFAAAELTTAELPVTFREFVVGADEASTKANIKAVKQHIDERVNAEVTNRLKAGGRIPAGAGQRGAGGVSGAGNTTMNSFIRQAAGRN